MYTCACVYMHMCLGLYHILILTVNTHMHTVFSLSLSFIVVRNKERGREKDILSLSIDGIEREEYSIT